MFCQKCGKELPDGVHFCRNCGTAVPNVSAQDHGGPEIQNKKQKKKKPFYQKWWFWAIVVILLLPAGTSGGSDDPAVTTGPSQTTAPMTETKPGGTTKPSVGTTNSGETEPEKTEPTTLIETTQPTPPQTTTGKTEVTIEEAVIYDEGGVRITVTGMKKAFTGIEFKMLLENNTEENIAVGCSDFIVNGIMVDGTFRIEAAAGKKSNGELKFYYSDLNDAGIDQISTIVSYDAYISNTDTYMKTKRIDLALATSLTDYTQELDDSGEILFQQDGITVIAKSLTDDFSGGTITVLIKNESGQDVIVQAKNLSVNGYTVSTLHSGEICDGTVRFCKIDIYQSDLTENGIEKIETVTFELSVINPDTYQTILKTGELQMEISG